MENTLTPEEALAEVVHYLDSRGLATSTVVKFFNNARRIPVYHLLDAGLEEVTVYRRIKK
jgi:hypothetical protein